MGRLIDADALIAQMEADAEQMEEPIAKMFTYAAINDVKHASTIEPERKTGKWIGTEYDGYADGNPVYYEWKCSACGCVIEDDEPTWNFCPNCGADMRGEQDD